MKALALVMLLVCCAPLEAQAVAVPPNCPSSSGALNYSSATNAYSCNATTAEVSSGTAQATGATTSRTLANHFTDHYNIKDWGAKCDGYQLFYGTTTSASAVISALNEDGTTHLFTDSDVGMSVVLYALDPGAPHGPFTILSHAVDGTTATMSSVSGLTQAGTVRLVFYKTNDTSAINQAISDISAISTFNGGSTLDAPGGLCAVSTITLKRNVILKGMGRQGGTTLFQLPASNADVVTTENFAALTGTGLNFGPTGSFNGFSSDVRVPSLFGLRDLQIDGDWLQQSSGNCVSLYGSGFMLNNILISGCHDVGLWSEAAFTYGYSPSDWHGQEECYIHDVIFRTTGKENWVNRGGHDCETGNVIGSDWGHSGSGYAGFKSQTSGNLYSGHSHYKDVHFYAPNNQGGRVNTVSMQMEAGGDYDLVYPDFGTVVLNAASHINKIFNVGGGAANGSPVIDMHADQSDIGQIDFSYDAPFPQGSPTSPTGVIGLNIHGSNEYVGYFAGSQQVSTLANNTLVKFDTPAFGYANATVFNAVGTNNIGVALSGSYMNALVRSFGNTKHVTYTAGSGHNQYSLLIYDSSGTALSGDEFTSTDDVHICLNSGRCQHMFPSGSNAFPAVSFSVDKTTGFSRAASGVVSFTSAGSEALRMGASGVGIGTTTPNAKLDVNDSKIIIETSSSPASNAACTAGSISWDTGFLYLCTASGVWKRAALTGGY